MILVMDKGTVLATKTLDVNLAANVHQGSTSEQLMASAKPNGI